MNTTPPPCELTTGQRLESPSGPVLIEGVQLDAFTAAPCVHALFVRTGSMRTWRGPEAYPRWVRALLAKARASA